MSMVIGQCYTHIETSQLITWTLQFLNQLPGSYMSIAFPRGTILDC